MFYFIFTSDLEYSDYKIASFMRQSYEGYTVKLGYNELGYNEQVAQSQLVILLHKSTRL